jgi:hypothetical protein
MERSGRAVTQLPCTPEKDGKPGAVEITFGSADFVNEKYLTKRLFVC